MLVMSHRQRDIGIADLLLLDHRFQAGQTEQLKLIEFVGNRITIPPFDTFTLALLGRVDDIDGTRIRPNVHTIVIPLDAGGARTRSGWLVVGLLRWLVHCGSPSYPEHEKA